VSAPAVAEEVGSNNRGLVFAGGVGFPFLVEKRDLAGLPGNPVSGDDRTHHGALFLALKGTLYLMVTIH
jgi:hypothetical protein